MRRAVDRDAYHRANVPNAPFTPDGVSVRLPIMLVRLPNVAFSLADDLVCPIFVYVCPTFGHGSLANVFVRPPDVVFSPPDDDFHPAAYVSEPDGDDCHAHAYVSEPAEHVSEAEDYDREPDDDVFGTVEYVREAAKHVSEPENYLCEADGYVEARAGAGDDGQRGGVRRAATDSGPFRAGTISGKAGFGLKAHDVTAWGEAPDPRTQIIPQPCKGETSIGPAIQALGEIGAAHYLGLRSSDSLQPRLSHGGLSALTIGSGLALKHNKVALAKARIFWFHVLPSINPNAP